MTRFWITLPEAVDLVLYAMEHAKGGEIFIPKIPSTRVTDLAEAMAPGVPRDVIGIRPGEKLHEILLTDDEARHAIETEDNYVVLPEHPWWTAEQPLDRRQAPRRRLRLRQQHQRLVAGARGDPRAGRGDVIPYGRQSVDDDDIDAVVQVLKGDWLTRGPAVEEFEHALADQVEARHAVAFASGTAALHGAVAVAGIGPGDRVATSALSFAASAACAAYVGATPDLRGHRPHHHEPGHRRRCPRASRPSSPCTTPACPSTSPR